MAITSINGMPPPPVGNVSASRQPAAPADDASLRAAEAAAQGSGVRPQEARSVTNATRSDASRERNRREQPSEEQVKSAVEQLNDFMQVSTSNLQFSVDKESGMRIVKVVDPETKEVIRQMPSEEAVEIAKAIGKLQGLLIRQTA